MSHVTPGFAPKTVKRQTTFKIYQLERILTQASSPLCSTAMIPESTYDQVVEFIIIAETQQEAREMASDQPGDEGAHVWLDRRKSTIKELGTATKPCESRVVIRDYNQA